jgi:hypothetical protein
MKPLKTLYLLRFVLGIIAALVCIGYGLLTNTIIKDPGLDISIRARILMNGIALAFIVYVLSYYVIKPKFIWRVDKPQKVFTTGIGIYILSWLVFWSLLYTII